MNQTEILAYVLSAMTMSRFGMLSSSRFLRMLVVGLTLCTTPITSEMNSHVTVIFNN